VGEEEDKI